jgi:hypothetical protein
LCPEGTGHHLHDAALDRKGGFERDTVRQRRVAQAVEHIARIEKPLFGQCLLFRFGGGLRAGDQDGSRVGRGLRESLQRR